MKNLTIIFLLFSSTYLYSQSFRAAKNVMSTSLFQPFTSVGGYTLSYERSLDPGYSPTVAQFSYKLNMTFIESDKRRSLIRQDNQTFYDSDAVQYSGYSIFPEFRYYFTWDAPVGVYMNLFGSYSNYTRTYNDVRIGDVSSDIRNYSELGRGIGAGYQFKVFNDFTLDIVAGYLRLNISSETKRNGSDEFLENPDEKDEKLYMNFHLGLNF